MTLSALVTTVTGSWGPVLRWLVETSFQAGLLVVLILAGRVLLRDRLAPRWRYALWLVLVVRLALPWAPQTRWSVYNLVPEEVRAPGEWRALAGMESVATSEGGAERGRHGGAGEGLEGGGEGLRGQVAEGKVGGGTAAGKDAGGTPAPQGMEARGADAKAFVVPALAGNTASGSVAAKGTGERFPAKGTTHAKPAEAGTTYSLAAKAGTTNANPAEAGTTYSLAAKAGTTNAKPAEEGTVNGLPDEAGITDRLRAEAGTTNACSALAELLFWLPIVWLAGAVALLGMVAAQSAALALAVGRRPALADWATMDLLAECRATMGIGPYLLVYETPRVSAPALFGVWRPRLLLPEGAVAALGPERLRHVFLHELAHLRRRDVAMNWVVTLLQVCHWFNPLVWVAFQRMRADRELACDALVLARLAPEEVPAYGRTIIYLMECLSRPPAGGALRAEEELVSRPPAPGGAQADAALVSQSSASRGGWQADGEFASRLLAPGGLRGDAEFVSQMSASSGGLRAEGELVSRPSASSRGAQADAVPVSPQPTAGAWPSRGRGLSSPANLAGILEDRREAQRRIGMIARFKQNPPRWPVLAIVLLAALACFTLTNAKKSGTGAASPQPAVASTTGKATASPTPPTSVDKRPLDKCFADLALPRSDASGTVVDKSGNPVADADVFLYYSQGVYGSRDRLAGQTQTGADGRFRIAQAVTWEPITEMNLEGPPKLFFLARHPALGMGHQTVVQGECADEVKLELSPPRDTRVMHVCDPAGHPIPGANVYLSMGGTGRGWSDQDEREHFRFTLTRDIGLFSGLTDDAGQLEVPLWVSLPEIFLTVEKEGYVSAKSVLANRGHPLVNEVTLYPSARLEGTVTWPDGSPASDIAVRLRYFSRPWNEATCAVATDANGHYCFQDAPAKNYRDPRVAASTSPTTDTRLTISLEDLRPDSRCLPEETSNPPLEPGQRVVRDFRLRSGYVISGTVVNEATGRAVPHMGIANGGPGPVIRIRTDERGKFRVQTDHPSWLSLYLQPSTTGEYLLEGNEVQFVTKPEVTADILGLTVKARLRPLAPLPGRVTGASIDKGIVLVDKDLPPAKVGAGGEFLLKVAPTDRGFDVLAMETYQGGKWSGFAHYVPGTGELSVAAEPLAGSVATVQDQHGGPVGGLCIFVNPRLNGKTLHQFSLDVQTDAQGHCTLPLCPHLSWRAEWASVWSLGGHTQNQNVESGETVIDLAAIRPGGSLKWTAWQFPASLAGRVVSARDGQPVAGARIGFAPGSRPIGEARVVSSADGRFQANKADRGVIELRVSAPGYADKTLSVQPGADARIALAPLPPAAQSAGAASKDSAQPGEGLYVEGGASPTWLEIPRLPGKGEAVPLTPNDRPTGASHQIARKGDTFVFEEWQTDGPPTSATTGQWQPYCAMALSKTVPGDLDLVTLYEPEAREGVAPEKWETKAYPLPRPLASYLHRLPDARVKEYDRLGIAYRGVTWSPDRPDLGNTADRYTTITLAQLAVASAMVADAPNDPFVRVFHLDALAARRDITSLRKELDEWRARFEERPVLRAALRHLDQTWYSLGVSESGRNGYDFQESLFRRPPDKDVPTLLQALPGIQRYGACLPPHSPISGLQEYNHVGQDYPSIVQTGAALFLMEGHPQYALEAAVSSYRLGQMMNKNGQVRQRGLAWTLRTASARTLETCILDGCARPEDVRGAWLRLEWLNERERPATARDLFLEEDYGRWFDDAKWLEFPPFKQRTETALRRKTLADAQFQLLRLGAAAWYERLKTGAFPKNAGEFGLLTPAGALPRDPFDPTSATLRFVERPDALVCYSVGPDGKDDGGALVYDSSNGTKSGGDIVLEVPRERKYPFPAGGVQARDRADLLRQFPNGLPPDVFAESRRAAPRTPLGATDTQPVIVYSVGPDRMSPADDDSPERKAGQSVFPLLTYDPTNGTHSAGDIWLVVPTPGVGKEGK